MDFGDYLRSQAPTGRQQEQADYRRGIGKFAEIVRAEKAREHNAQNQSGSLLTVVRQALPEMRPDVVPLGKCLAEPLNRHGQYIDGKASSPFAFLIHPVIAANE